MIEYTTRDICLAAVLKLTDAKLSAIVPVGPTQVEFQFTNVDETKITNYELGNLLVEPSDFHSIIRHLSQLAKKKVTG